MSDLELLLDRNRLRQAHFEFGNLGIPPRLSTMILTCVDTRVDPAHLFGLEPGDALILRNTGGRVTSGVLFDLAVLTTLSRNWPGDAELELIVIHHTDCGMQRLTNPDVQSRIASGLGVPVGEVAALAITDPTASVRHDVELIRGASDSPRDTTVTGLVYDVTTGTLTRVT